MGVELITRDARIRELCQAATRPSGVIHVAGLWGSSTPMVAAQLAQQTARPVLYITAHMQEAEDVQDDLEFFLKGATELFPAWETLPGEGAAAGEIEAERVRLCHLLADLTSAASPPVVVASILALMQPVPTKAMLVRNSLELHTGNVLSHKAADTVSAGPDALVQWCVDHGFERLELVESPGDFARRGDIVDIFPPGETFPMRVEFFDDTIESIRTFDLSTQRSLQPVSALRVNSVANEPWTAADETATLFDYLPANTLLVLDPLSDMVDLARTFRRRVSKPERLRDIDDLLAQAARFTMVQMDRFAGGAATGDVSFEFDVSSVARFEGGTKDAVEELVRLAADHMIYVICDTPGEQQRLTEMLQQATPAVHRNIHMISGIMHRGFEWRATRTIVIPHHEVFRRIRPVRRIRRFTGSLPVESWTDLNIGDFVVHTAHGIGIYRGLQKFAKPGETNRTEYLTIEYADHGVVHVPVAQIELVQKYIGVGNVKPKLSRLGTKTWSRTRAQVAESVNELAIKLLETQARREQAEGTAYPPDTEWMREFEAAFPYEETQDQLRVAAEVKDDLQRQRPMDRLICGDVGFGKTELAIRAAFKVVEFGKQVAFLVPTTVLAEQHYETMLDRMREYPFTIGCLSRFRSGSEQTRILRQLVRGQMDIVVGTHRLLSKDVHFANLGLVVIDEEQRFGVEHKEGLRTIRADVDVLTLSATPIPRTLHMAMMGLRDISSLQTPPIDRRSIVTQVRQWSKDLIRDAILREMNRGGQVYIVHNFVQSIQEMTATIQSIVPEARVVYGHGQMSAGELEEVMHRFVQHKADILVATTIIESGIDVPNANTIIINQAHRFGLADLHQLRGRVGRSSHRAYCYLMLSPRIQMKDKAARRLKAIEEFSELGAGFRIAMRDLEIRGAGNLLGKEQSGHIAAVGYEMYCQMLAEAVQRLKGEIPPDRHEVHVDLGDQVRIPPQYVASDRSRIEMYRRLAACQTQADIKQLLSDMRDAFGPPPPPVLSLLELAEIRVLARPFGIRSIRREPPDVIFVFTQPVASSPVFRHATGSVRVADSKTVHLRLDDRFFEPGTLLPVLRNMLLRANEPVEPPSAPPKPAYQPPTTGEPRKLRRATYRRKPEN